MRRQRDEALQVDDPSQRIAGQEGLLNLVERWDAHRRALSSIDALAIARAALQEPGLEGPRADEEPLHELKPLVDHPDDLVDERRRCQQRLRWHLHELDPTVHVPLGALDRTVWLDRLGRKLARRRQTVQLRIAGQLLARCRALTRTIVALDRELEQRTQTLAPRLLQLPGCGPVSAAKLLCEIGPIDRFRTDALHRIAITQGRVNAPACAYLERKQNEGKSRREATRCLRRQLARTVYSTLKADSALK